jgi:hypothetical protein
MRYKSKMANVDKPTTVSLSIISCLRLERSTITPANGAIATLGARKKKPIKANAVAEPVTFQAQRVSAKTVIRLPMVEII